VWNKYIVSPLYIIGTIKLNERLKKSMWLQGRVKWIDYYMVQSQMRSLIFFKRNGTEYLDEDTLVEILRVITCLCDKIKNWRRFWAILAEGIIVIFVQFEGLLVSCGQEDFKHSWKLNMNRIRIWSMTSEKGTAAGPDWVIWRGGRNPGGPRQF